eukprot:gene6540-8358_t
MAKYEASDMKIGPRNDPAYYLGKIDDMIKDLSAVRRFVESGDFMGALGLTTQIVYYNPNLVFSYEGTDTNGRRVHVPYITYRDPIPNEDDVKRGNITGSAEWSFQLAIYQVQLITLNLNRKNFFPGLAPGDPRYDVIQGQSPSYYNPRPSIDHVTLQVLWDVSSLFNTAEWRKDALFYIDYHLKGGGLMAKRACVQRRVLGLYLRRVVFFLFALLLLVVSLYYLVLVLYNYM